VVVFDISNDAIAQCKPLFSDGQEADTLHAATCLSADGILISNDRHGSFQLLFSATEY
jgi:hypothetical protein